MKTTVSLRQKVRERILASLCKSPKSNPQRGRSTEAAAGSMISSSRHSGSITSFLSMIKYRQPYSHPTRGFPSLSSNRPLFFSVSIVTVTVAVATVAAMDSVSESFPPLHYPLARRDYAVVHDYHGIFVPDPYNWLEDANSEETKAFVKAQAALTSSVLADCGEREQLRRKITAFFDHLRYETPFKRGGKYFYFHNSAFNPRAFCTSSEDGTVALSSAEISSDGKYLAYGLSSNGSDWVKFFPVVWSHDGKGFFYGRYPEPTFVKLHCQNASWKYKLLIESIPNI
ncbi:hypothetical protein KSP40_PGU022655 [Platanthera guangdongensis]|uniref:Peptidase S9A N-terminal domain-containing protein n=1 Tax=Platanthera guangdongensis TaxID=2320717 RepID=A0ABR2LLS5_9ASPA